MDKGKALTPASNQVAPEPLPQPPANAQTEDANTREHHHHHRKKSKRPSKDDPELDTAGQSTHEPPKLTREERLKEKISKLTIAGAVKVFEAHKKFSRKKLTDPNAIEKREPRLSLEGISQTSALTLHDGQVTICPEELERREVNESSDTIRNIMIGIVPTKATPGISGYVLDQFIESTVPDCPAGMERIIDLDHVFIEPTSRETFLKLFPQPLRHMYELKSIDSKILYIGAETLKAYNSYPTKAIELDFTFTGPEGGLVFYVYGNSKMLKIGNEDTRFGKIVRLGFLEKPNSFYQILNHQDVPIFELIPTTNHRTKELEYKVLCLAKDSHGVIGLIKRRYSVPPEATTAIVPNTDGKEKDKTPLGEELFRRGSVYGINFPKDLNPTHKTLLIGAMIFLNHKQTVPTSYGPNKKRFKFGLLFSLLVCLICLTCLLIIIILTVTSNPTPHNYAKIEPCPVPPEEKHGNKS